jgi:peptidoglycan lytic transglycosylase B
VAVYIQKLIHTGTGDKLRKIFILESPYYEIFKQTTWVALLVVILFITAFQTKEVRADDGQWYDALERQLVKDGFESGHLKKIFKNPSVHFNMGDVSRFFMHSESRLNYDQYLSKSNISRAGKYMKKHRVVLDRAEKKFGVDKTAITAIILVETRFGTILGNSPVFNTLATMAALGSTANRKRLWKSMSDSRRIDRKRFESKAGVKSKWAYTELKAFLKYTGREKIDPTAIHGSYAGALGVAQFIPSSILALAIDGNGDGRIDLFNHTDAIYSIANYMKRHGWKPGISREKAYKVVLKYNYSKYYANTILKISDLLKGNK